MLSLPLPLLEGVTETVMVLLLRGPMALAEASTVVQPHVLLTD